MTPPSSERALPATHAGRERPHSARTLALVRRRWRLIAGGAVLLAILLAGLIALAYHQGFFVRGPEADAATAFLTDVQHNEYTAAYTLLAPDLKAEQTEQVFAAAMDGIRQTDGPVTSFAARELQSGSSGVTVVGFDMTRTIRGTFSVHISLIQDKSGRWLISGMDDL